MSWRQMTKSRTTATATAERALCENWEAKGKWISQINSWIDKACQGNVGVALDNVARTDGLDKVGPVTFRDSGQLRKFIVYK